MHASDQNPEDRRKDRARILLADTNRWAIPARLAIEFRELGCVIAVVGRSPGHPAERVQGIEQVFPYSGRAPLQSLRTAIEAFNPDIIVPSSDRDVQQLHELHAICTSSATRNAEIAQLIERSLGAPHGFRIACSRFELLSLALAEGIPVPKLAAISCERDLQLWESQAEHPWVMKADGTSEGKGVHFVNSALEAAKLFREYSNVAGVTALLKKLLLNRDWDWVTFDWKHSKRSIIAQTVIEGRPANCAVFCWQGEVLAGVAVEAIKTRGACGPATLVQVVEGTEMLAAAKVIARRLGKSGFFGLDFVIERHTCIPYLIEMNPRCTPPCILPMGPGRNLVAALWSKLTGQLSQQDLPVIKQQFIAYFPQTEDGSGTLDLTSHEGPVYLDMPRNEPELIRELLHSRSSRTILGRLVDKIRKKHEIESVAVVEKTRESVLSGSR